MEALTISDKELNDLNIPDEDKEVKLTPLRTVAPIEQIIAYAQKGLSYTEIGKLICPERPVSRSAICQRLKTAGYTPERLKAWKKSKADVLELLQSNLAGALTDRDFKKESTRDLIVSLGIVIDKERLITNKSTANVVTVVGHINTQLTEAQDAVKNLIEGNGHTVDIQAEETQ